MACLHFFGAEIKGYAQEPEYNNGLFDLLQPLQLSESIIADIRDKNRLQKEIDSFQPDYIFHLAAQAIVRRSYKIPAETFEINVVGTANLLEAVNSLAKKCTIVIITTDKVYQNKEQDILYSEENVLGGYDPYSASKACTEILVTSFRNSFFNPVVYHQHQKSIATARAGNVIGGGDWTMDRIVPDIVSSLQQQQPIEVRNPGAVRPWQHVLEPIAGYLLLAGRLNEESSKCSTAYNFGPLPKDHLTVKELVETAIKYWGHGNWKDAFNSDQPHEASLLKLDISRAMKELGWEPKLNADNAIKWTIEWYKQPLAQQAAFTFQQIKEYFAS
jgi:CDP-glucose 4,6-dehydratase